MRREHEVRSGADEAARRRDGRDREAGRWLREFPLRTVLRGGRLAPIPSGAARRTRRCSRLYRLDGARTGRSTSG